MEKNHTDSNPMSMCEKILKAIGVGSTPQSKRHISYCPQDPLAEMVPIVFDPPISPAEMVPIVFDPPIWPASPNGEERLSNNKNDRVGKLAPKIELEHHIASMEEDMIKPAIAIGDVFKVNGEELGFENIDDKSSNYISRTKIKIRATSNVGPRRAASHVAHLNSSSGMDSGHNNDKFSEFIARTKMRMRATSNVGRGKSSPGIDSTNQKFSDYINRAKARIRTTSNVSAGKGVSLERNRFPDE